MPHAEQSHYSFITDLAKKDSECDRPIFVVNLDDIRLKVLKWKEVFKRVTPYYAMKCNDVQRLLTVLADMGCGFDCASKKELQAARAAGVTGDRIVFANPCKTRDMLRFVSTETDVRYMTFDSETELRKIQQECPIAKLLIRLKVDDSLSRYKLGDKFGASREEVHPLLALAQRLDLQIVGIAFHVGSGSEDPNAFASAIKSAKQVSLLLPSYGFEFKILDIGGGFPGIIDFDNQADLFYQMASVVNQSLDQYFPPIVFPDLKIISEPGKYFVASAFTLLTKVVGKRVMTNADGPELMYYLNDGIFGSFLIKLWEPELIRLTPLLSKEELELRETFSSTFWGPTCDSSDVVAKQIQMKELQVDEYLMVST